MCTGTLRKAAALLVALFLVGACTDGSSHDPLTSPSFAASSSSLPHINNTTLPIPGSISACSAADGGSNTPGPQITFSGGSFLGGYGVEMTFTNNMKGTHTYTDGHTVDVTVMPADEPIVIPRRPGLGGAGGNPFIWVQFVGANGAALSDEIFVGRCVRGAGWHVTQSAVTTASAYATFTVTGCENSPGPYINFTSGVTMAGMSARIIFRNNDNPVGGPHEADVTRTVAVIPVGLNLTFPKQPVLGGVGGNPWIFAGFTDVNGTELGEPTLLGRCEQLSKVLS